MTLHEVKKILLHTEINQPQEGEGKFMDSSDHNPIIVDIAYIGIQVASENFQGILHNTDKDAMTVVLAQDPIADEAAYLATVAAARNFNDNLPPAL